MEDKTLLGVEVKNVDQGIALVRFADYDDMDKHGDVTRKGAFEDGAVVAVSAYNHATWQPNTPPIGKGVLRTGGDAAYAELKFFLNTTAGRETFEVIKEMGEHQQWSYGFDVEKKSMAEWGEEKKTVRVLEKLKVHEISPVMVGAGNSTETIAVKRNFTAEERRHLAETGKAMPDGSFPIVNKEDLQNAIRLAGNADNPGKARAHIRKRARALGAEDMIPESWGKSENDGNMKMVDECIAVLTAVKSLADRAEEIVKLRKADGKKGLSPETTTLLGLVGGELKRVNSLLAPEASTETPSNDEPNRVIAEAFRILSEE